MLAAAVCPHPPMLVPAVAQGATDDLVLVRDACRSAVAALLTWEPDVVVVLAADAVDADESAGGTFARYGVDERAGGDDLVLGLGHTVGAWLLDEAGWTGARRYVSALPTDERSSVVLTMADGSAKRSTAAPGYLDERAEPFDGAVARALASGDPEALGAIDVDLAAELWCTGARPLHALADATKGATVTARLRYDGAPLGVGYWVADWTIAV